MSAAPTAACPRRHRAQVDRLRQRPPAVEGRGATVPAELTPSACVNLVHVRVDRDTGRVDVLDVAHVQDVGHAINPTLCEGQMRGGVTQSIGYALYEELVYDEDGNLATPTFLGYAIPRAAPAHHRHRDRRGALEARAARRQGHR